MKTKLVAFKLGGEFNIRHIRNGQVLSEIKIHNTTTSAGKALVAGLLNGSITDSFKWLALDSDDTAAYASDTALTTEITANGCERLEATCTRVTTDDTNDTAQLLHTWTASGIQAIRGIGVFDTSTQEAGNMLARSTFAVKNLNADDTFKATYKVDID